METFVILIAVANNDARQICEDIENTKYSFTEKPNMMLVRDKIIAEVDDDELADTLSVYRITDFMDDCNDQLIVLDGFFMGYVHAEQNEVDDSFDYQTHGDFKKYYDNKMERNIWVLGYFGGGSVNISNANKLAKAYAETNDVPYEEVKVDEIFRSRRFKGFKYMFATNKQKPDADAECMDDVFKWLTD